MRRQRNRVSVFCAFCRLPRKIYAKKGLGGFEILVLLFVTLSFSFLIFHDFHALPLIGFGGVLVFLEVAMRFRRRLSLVCQHCGFDPVLYGKDPALAAEKVQRFLEHRKSDPQFLLKPALNLPVRKVPSSSGDVLRREKSQGKILSKTI